MRSAEGEFRPAMIGRPKFYPLTLLIVAVATFARTLGGEFLRWDDRQNILLNPFIERALWSQTWTRPYYNMYIPVTYSVWTLLWHITPSPWIFHLLNVGLHATNTLLVYLIGRRALANNRPAAFVAALIFAVHPLQVETVAWISTGRDLLSACFGLTATYLVLTKTKPWWWALATLLFALGLLSKPSLAVLPVGVAALSWASGRFSLGRRVTLAVWLGPALAAVIATKIIQQLDADLRLVPLGLFDRLVVAADTLGFYVHRIFVPHPLGSDYGRSPRVALANFNWLPNVLITLAVLTLLYLLRRRFTRGDWAGWFWAVLFVAPVLGLIPFQAQGQSTVSDRYAYLPMVGVGLALGSLGARYARILFPVLALFTAMTIDRTTPWLNNRDFFHDMLNRNPTSFVAHSSLGVEYILRNELDQASYYLNEAIRLKPTDSIPRTNLVQLYLLQKRPDRVTAELGPLFDDRDFLHQNQTETRALASGFRMIARAHWMQGHFGPANALYCRWFRLDWENEEGKEEVKRFIEDANKHHAPLERCDLIPAS